MKLNDLDTLKEQLENEFQRTIFRIISLIITWLVGILSIYIFIDIQPLIDQIGVPTSILFVILFPILLVIAWGAADHQRRTEFNEESEVIQLEHSISNVDHIIENVSANPLAMEITSSGGAIYKTRGTDPKGVAVGGGADTFDSSMPKIDGMHMRMEHQGLEAKLEHSTEIKVEADAVATEIANNAWIEAERNDSELIEAGVERLGDLVGSGHFEGPRLSNPSDSSESP